MSLLELRARPEIAVVELGMNHPGEIRTLVAVAEPEVRVWTNVGDAHLGFFASPDAIADAKAEILEHARPDDVLVANANDARVMARARSFTGQVVTFGVDTAADVAASNVAYRGLEGTSARLVTARGAADITVPLLGAGNLANVLAAAAVALEFDVPVSEIVERAAGLRPATHRGSERGAGDAGEDEARKRIASRGERRGRRAAALRRRRMRALAHSSCRGRGHLC